LSIQLPIVRRPFPHLPYVSLELPDVRRRALDDPRGFLREYAEGAILDEVQNTPELLSYLQVEAVKKERKHYHLACSRCSKSDRPLGANARHQRRSIWVLAHSMIPRCLTMVFTQPT
jgi:hypothetical protein